MNSNDYLSNSPEIASLIQSETSNATIDLAETDSLTLSSTENLKPGMFQSDYYSNDLSNGVGSDRDYFQMNAELLLQLSTQNKNDDDVVLRENGYVQINKICDTLQGALFKANAISMDSMREKPHYVAIKKTNKALLKEHIAIEDDISLCVSENLVKEALILRYLTVHNTPIGYYIAKYIDFFESDTDYYLVMEYIDSEMSLKQFISQSRQYITDGTLSIQHYRKMVKYLLWQLVVTIQWMHLVCHSAHMDLCSENVMLQNATFIESQGVVSINPSVSVKLVDFGVAEVFHSRFSCEKTGLSIINEGYHSPNVFHHEIFDARCADNWMLGIILFECMTLGAVLYSPLTMYQSRSGYSALHHHKLREYLSENRLLQYFNKDSFSLIHGLLNVDERQRLKGMGILKHKWFSMYFGRYKDQIHKKFGHQKKMSADHFPFYYDIKHTFI